MQMHDDFRCLKTEFTSKSIAITKAMYTRQHNKIYFFAGKKKKRVHTPIGSVKYTLRFFLFFSLKNLPVLSWELLMNLASDL